MTFVCDGYIIGIKTKEGRGSAHYELIWEIPVKIELRGDSMRKNQGESTTTGVPVNRKNAKGGNLADDVNLS